MPTSDLRRALTLEELRGTLEGAVTGRGTERGLGLEVELLAYGAEDTTRTPIEGPRGSLAALTGPVDERLEPERGWRPGPDGWRCRGWPGLRLGFEPGGQLEVSSAYARNPAGAVASTEEAVEALTTSLARQDVRLVSSGIDLWRPGSAPQQLPGPRYPAMDRSLAARGPWGRLMMRDTCALQLNLDLGRGAEALARWTVTNLLAPVATASFACSPSPQARCLRSLAWQRLDTTRTGFVNDPRRAGAELVDDLARFALEADVLFVGAGGASHTVAPGWRFADWLRSGHPVFGRPTHEDLETHLSTLFPEVRPRGYLEIRSIDAVPAPWRRAVTTLYLGATYDPVARDRILEVLTPDPRPLGEQLHEAAVRGVADPVWCARAVEVWSFAVRGAGRLPASTVPRSDLWLTEAFLDRFTLRGLTPGDELAGAWQRGGPRAALDWATEPVPHAAARQAGS